MRFGPSLTAAILLLLFSGCSSHDAEKSEDSPETQESDVRCSEPENTYPVDSGHYKGFEWAEEHVGATCSGPSTSFNEGCEDYEEQEAEFEKCEAHKKN
jgi:hypothetical protein